ncbi:MAG: hypothetical protein Q9N68_04415 [Gammaproteobacteria bacterium]|nr:hypothetical protein [Gammaproteobacteria bacterium]
MEQNTTKEMKNKKAATGIRDSKFYAHIPGYSVIILLLIMFIFLEKIAMIFHGTPNTFSAGKIGNGNFSSKKLVSFWTPTPCKNTDEHQDLCTHEDLKKSYLNTCKKENKTTSRYDCDKLEKRLENGYYYIAEKHIDRLEKYLINAKADGFNYFKSKGASRGSFLKPGLWWEVTFSKNSDINQDKLKKIVNYAFKRKENTPASRLNIKNNQQDTDITDMENERILDIWRKDKMERAPLIDVYAEIRG